MDSLRLKWGTFKGGNFESDAAKEAWGRYCADTRSLGAMTQDDTEGQKQALLDLCDAVEASEGTIYLDWDGEYVNAQQAKEYITNYRMG